MTRVCANGIELDVEEIGAGEPLLLIMGLGAQLVYWPDEFCRLLADRGFRVIRFDNRDVGRSTWLRGVRVPPIGATLLRSSLGLPVASAYTLHDMADDAVGVLDALGIERAHLVGASMGGMIAQAAAIRHPGRVASLTSIMSTTGERRYRWAHPRALRALLAPAPRSRSEAVARQVAIFRAIGSPGYPSDEALLADMAARAYDRGHHPAGFVRQLSAILASPSRAALLRRLDVPALVVHGTHDPLVPVGGGRATARALRGRLLLFDGMGHDLPRALWRAMAGGIRATARRR